MGKRVTWIIEVEARPDYPREEGMVGLHKVLQSFQISFPDDYDNIECPIVLTYRQLDFGYWDVPFRKSPNANAVATPLKFGVPSLDIQFADSIIVSVPGERGGWI